MAGPPPSIAESTREQRLAYLRSRYVCIANCDQCGICATFHGKDPEHALADYLDGRAEFLEVAKRYRR